MLNEIITIYAITDDLLKAKGHEDDVRREMTDAEIMTTAVCAAMFFNGNHSKACAYMKEYGLIPNMARKITIQSAVTHVIDVNQRFISSNRDDT
ncbi:transposase (plasmid) [Fischerella sp. NIES-4106]|nr:transposase [Fischerella sp. NIES-4106]